MMIKIIATLIAVIAVVQAGVLPHAYHVAPYASTYNAHHINHAVAHPVLAAPAPVAVPAPHPAIFAAPSPVALPAAQLPVPAHGLFAAPAPVFSAPAAPAPFFGVPAPGLFAAPSPFFGSPAHFSYAGLPHAHAHAAPALW